MHSIYFDKLYSTEAGELDFIDDDVLRSFVFQGSKNWDLYFSKKPNIEFFEIHSNVKLTAFNLNEENEFKKHLHKDIIDYSIEHVHEEGVNSYYILEENA